MKGNINKKSTKNGNNSGSVRPKGSVKSRPRPKRNMVNSALVSQPAAFSRAQNPIMRIDKTINGSRYLKFKEYVQDIAGSVSFSANSFPVNPGVPTLFAWLAGQAMFYQEYRFKSLRFIFETEKSTATSGKVMYAFQQDPSDALPVSKQEMLENQMRASAAPWQPFNLSIQGLSSFSLSNTRFVRTGTLASNLDIKTFDIGQLIVATQGMADTTAVGELYVEYEIDLITPIQSVLQLSSSLSKLFTGVSPGQTTLLGTSPTSVGSLDVTGTVNTLTFNRVGRYEIVVYAVGTGLFTAFTPVTTGSTALSLAQYAGISNAAANVGTTAIAFFTTVSISSRGQTVILDCTTQSTTITASAITVSGFVGA